MTDNPFEELVSLPPEDEDKPILCLLGFHKLDLRIKVWGYRYDLILLGCERCKYYHAIGPADFPYDFFDTHRPVKEIIKVFLAEYKHKHHRKAF